MTPQEELAALRRLAELEARAQGARGPSVGAINALGQGLNTAIANVLGTPVDLATAAIGTIGHQAGLLREPPALERSFGGSASIRRGLGGLGLPTYGNINELPPDVRKYAVGGETFARSVLPAAAGLRVAQTAGAVAPQLLDPATRMARELPARFLAAETAMAGGSAGGAAFAEAAFPGSPGARLAGELIGGTVSPMALAFRAGGPVAERAKLATESFSEAGRENAAARTVQRMFQNTGESPDAVVRALRAPNPLGLELTSGQMAASPTLLGLETRLASASPQFRSESAQRADRAFENIQQASKQMAGAAPIAPLTAAARARVGETQGLVRSRAQAAQQRAEATREAVGRVPESQMTTASVAAREALDQSMTSARKQERALWEQIPRDIPIEPTGVLAARERIRSELLPNENLPQPVETFTGNLARGTGRNVEVSTMTPEGIPMIGTEQTQAVTSSGDLLQLRNRALTAAREARGGANPNYSLAWQMDAIADGALDDLSRMNVPGVEQAREFSRNLNQAMTQGEPGRIMQRAARGGQQVPAELTLERSFRGSGFTNTGGGTPGATAFRELQQGAAFGGQGQTMQNAQETFLRGAAQAAMTPDGRVNPNALNTFLRRNQELLNQFPQLRTQLSSAERAERLFLQTSAITQKAERNAAQTLFGQIAGGNDPVTVVNQIIRSNDPTQGIESLARSAQRAGPDAMNGLRSATIESMLKQSSDASGRINFERFNQLLNVPRTYQQGAESVMQTMRRTNVLDENAANRLQMIVDRANVLTRAVGNKSDFDKLMDDPDMLSDFVMRTVGANIGASAGGGTGATLVAAKAGSEAVRKLFAKMPMAKTQAVLIEAAKNPALMAKLLQKPTSVNQARETMRQINAYMLNAGIEFAYDSDEERRPLQRSLDTIGN
jgi:hypothetical protein